MSSRGWVADLRTFRVMMNAVLAAASLGKATVKEGEKVLDQMKL